MIQIGATVQVKYPEYAAGMRGTIQAQEASGRWIVKLEVSSLTDRNYPWVLSLEASDFEVIRDTQAE